eukprot:TRINITY_DN46685_c0_g1_i1.p1 TRINITY_DN46685_c0_g1~~TRINITY_DN46685_c0_g1_i1.p1  ORF type:complete len:824 (+),score=38.12 TRINITY_DN46685_c0_g1_i1:199-2472(+)
MPFACLCRVTRLNHPSEREHTLSLLQKCSLTNMSGARRSATPDGRTRLSDATFNYPKPRRRSSSNTVPPQGIGRYASEFSVIVTPDPSTLLSRIRSILKTDPSSLDIIPIRTEFEGWTNYHDADTPVFRAPWRIVSSSNRFVHQRGTGPVEKGSPSVYSITSPLLGASPFTARVRRKTVSTEYEKCNEYQRYYPVKGWGAPKLPGDPPGWDRRKEDVTCPDGWEWVGDWYTAGDGLGWEYSFTFSTGIKRGGGRERWSTLTRRRRWLRHRVRKEYNSSDLEGVSTSTAMLATSLGAIQQNFFSAGKSVVPEAQLGKYAPVVTSMKDALATSVIPPKERWCPFNGTKMDAFTGKDAVDWLLTYKGEGVLPRHSSSVHSSGASKPPSSPNSPKYHPGGVNGVHQGFATRQDAILLLEQLRLQGIVTSSVPNRTFLTKFRDDTSLYHFQDIKTDAAEVYQEVIAALTPQLNWLSPVSFNPNSAWFKNVSRDVNATTQIVEEFASHHRHRWKSKSHQCLHCGDLLVEDGVVRLLCGHTLCKECCKVFLLKQEQYNIRTGVVDTLGSDLCENLLICEICCSPTTIKITQNSIGLTHYETVRTALFVYDTEIIYENHRRRLTTKYNKKYLLVSDRCAFSNSDGTVKKPSPDQIELPGPEWVFVEPWHCVTGATTDSSGWQYAFNWKYSSWDDPHWSPTPTGLSFVRRRKLRRLRVNSSGTRYVREQLARELERRQKSIPTVTHPASPYFLKRTSTAMTSESSL